MSVWNALRGWFGAGSEGGAEEIGVEEVALREAVGVTVDADEDQWRPISQGGKRNLNPVTQLRMQELGVHLWKTNPLANRLVELPVAYLLADGVRLVIDDEGAQGWLKAWWNDPINLMDLKLTKKVRELALFGEQCYPVFVNQYSGHMRLGYLDPSRIATVVTDPDNVEQPIGIVTTRDRKGGARRYRVIVNGPESMFSRRAQEIRQSFGDGECFYFTVNDLSAASRGHSDLLPVMDWLDAYDHVMFGEIERWDHLRAFVWDVTLKGATKDEVEARARQIVPPSPGSVRVHNDAEEWAAVAPDLKGADSAEAARLYRNHILGSGTLPEHWYGGGGDVNRAVGAEMAAPTFKLFTMRQKYIGHMLEVMAQYQVWRRLDPTGPLPDPADFDEALKPRVEWPEMVPKDTASFAAALAQVVMAAATAVERGLLSAETAVEVVASVAAGLGVEIDVAAELETARAEAAEKATLEEAWPDLPGRGDGGAAGDGDAG